jgi:putative ABC transport system permease protein
VSQIRAFFSRLVGALNRRRQDDELASEIQSHITLHVEDLVRRGVDPIEARRQAILSLGGIDPTVEAMRDRRSLPLIEALWQDVRYGMRLLRRTPAYTAIAVGTLALGIGANTAIFTLVDAVLLKSLPVDAPEQLVVIDRVTRRGEIQNASYPLFERLREQDAIFAGVLAAQDGNLRVRLATPEAGSSTEETVIQLVSGNFFDVLGVRPLVGRTLSPLDDRLGDAGAAVLSYDYWRGRFASDPNILGTTITLNGQTAVIVGVAPPGFFGEAVGRAPSIWLPLAMQPGIDHRPSMLGDPNVGWLRVIARLQPGTSASQATAALDVLSAQLRGEPGAAGRARWIGFAQVRLAPGDRGLPDFREQYSRPLRVLAAIAALVLLVACANVSSLLLTRATARQREVAVRLAIGAGRRRLVGQFLIESVLLAIIGGAIGLLLAFWGSQALLVLASSDTAPLPIAVTPNLRILAFTTVASSIAVVICGLAPAVLVTGVKVNDALKLTRPIAGRAPLSRWLVIVQVALAVILLAGAGLLVQTLHNLRTRDFGFAADALLQGRIEAPGYSAAQVVDVSRQTIEQFAVVPGVQSVSTGVGFGTGMSRTCCIAVDGYTHEPGEDREIATAKAAPGYFRTLRLPLVLGRDFQPSDADTAPGTSQVAIVNEAFVRRYFRGANPIGRRFGWGDPPKVTYATEIVGVAKDAIYGDVRQAVKPMIYVPLTPGPGWPRLLVRASGDPLALIETLQREVHAIDSHLQLSMRLVSAEVERSFVRERLLSKLSGFFAVLAATLTAIGLYGLTAFTVLRRTRDIAICMALGASGSDVLGAELRAALKLVAIGIGAGVLIAVPAAALIKNQLFGISPADPWNLVLVAALFTAVATLAAYIPARRASRVDPMVALRWE